VPTWGAPSGHKGDLVLPLGYFTYSHKGARAPACVRACITFLQRCLRSRGRVHGSAALRSELRVLRRKRRHLCGEARQRRRKLRIRRCKLCILRRQCSDLSGAPASCTPGLVSRRGTLSHTWHGARCNVCAARSVLHGRFGADRMAIGARCLLLRQLRLELGQASRLGEQRSGRLGSCARE
jgi:hypothetical protein